MLNKHKKEAIYEYFILQILDKFHKKKKKTDNCLYQFRFRDIPFYYISLTFQTVTHSDARIPIFIQL